MTTPSYPKHAMVDTETGAIYGIGDDLAHARADARDQMRRGRVDDVDAAMESLSDARISEAAAQYVADCGGSPSLAIRFGRLPGSHVVAIHLRDEEE